MRHYIPPRLFIVRQLTPHLPDALFEAPLEFLTAEANLDATVIGFAGRKLVTAFLERLEQCTQDTQAAFVESCLAKKARKWDHPSLDRRSKIFHAVERAMSWRGSPCHNR